MSELRDMVAETTQGVFERIPVTTGNLSDEQFQAAWTLLVEAGLPSALVPEALGGGGFSLLDAAEVARVCGREASGIPVAETMMANSLLCLAGLEVDVSPIGLASQSECSIGPIHKSQRLQGSADQVVGGRFAGSVLLEFVDADGRKQLASIPTDSLSFNETTNIANHPRGSVVFDCPVDEAKIVASSGPSLICVGACARVLQIAGALEAILDMTIAHVEFRVQFGRPLAKFQTVQDQVAQLAGATMAAKVAADLASRVFEHPEPELVTAVAKIRAGESARKCVAIAHQLHGAIGMCEEYQLAKYTRCLHLWQGEFGSGADWSEKLGARALASGANYWSFVTSI